MVSRPAHVRLRSGRRHAVYRLAPGLLLVFKPRGHREAEHSHDYGQRLRVLSGRLAVRTRAGVAIVGVRSGPLTLRRRQPHSTEALADSWLVAERRRPRA